MNTHDEILTEGELDENGQPIKKHNQLMGEENPLLDPNNLDGQFEDGTTDEKPTPDELGAIEEEEILEEEI